MIEYLGYTFVWYALLASVLMSAVCAMMGTYIVSKRLVFISGGIAHASLGGVGMGAFFHFSPLFGAMVFALLSSAGIKRLSRSMEVREDSAIAMLWTFGMSMGVLFVFLSRSFVPELQSYLFGNILTVTALDLWAMIVLLLVTLLLFGGFYRTIFCVSFDAEYASSLGVPVARMEYALLALVALTIVCCLHLVGVVMVIALLSIPPTIANLFVNRFIQVVWLSFLLGLLSCLGGLGLSFLLNVPSGASIVIVSLFLYALARGVKRIMLSVSS